MLSLVESLLTFVRLDQGEMALNRERVDLAPLLAEVLQPFQAQAVERKLTLTSEIVGDLPPVIADRQELTMALTHLVDNATKFTPAGGLVMVMGRPVAADGEGLVAEVSIQDTGVGIPEELHAKIFERFYQVDSSPTRQCGGVGIGLAVVKQIIEAHGSHVVVESLPGKGSTFRFRLPIAA